MVGPLDDPKAVAPALPVQRGTNQAGMRASNERLVLSLVRSSGALSKTEIARMTGLSAQTVSVIMRQLEAESLLRRGTPTRGRVGQPSVPLSLDPDGAYFLGVKVGRRSLDLVMVDFAGCERHAATMPHAYPLPGPALEWIRSEVATCERVLGPAAGRVAGLGLALPFLLWEWTDAIGAPAAEMDAWRDFDLRAELAARLPYPIFAQNDATAACGAELAFGAHADLRDFLYIYVGTFVGGGLVLDGKLYSGPRGNAGALGPMPVPGPRGGVVQLIDVASLSGLEQRLRASGDALRAGLTPDHWSSKGGPVADWIEGAAAGLAHAVVAAASVVDCKAVVLDGSFPPEVRMRLVDATAGAIGRLDTSGVNVPELRPGSIGPMARALGGASLPLFERFLIEPGGLAASGSA